MSGDGSGDGDWVGVTVGLFPVEGEALLDDVPRIFRVLLREGIGGHLGGVHELIVDPAAIDDVWVGALDREGDAAGGVGAEEGQGEAEGVWAGARVRSSFPTSEGVAA